MKIAHCLKFEYGTYPFDNHLHVYWKPAFYPEEEKIFTLDELKAIVAEMEKMK